LELSHLTVSENLLPVLSPNAKAVSDPFTLEFDSAGNLKESEETEHEPANSSLLSISR
jgi:hypothetical protein